MKRNISTKANFLTVILSKEPRATAAQHKQITLDSILKSGVDRFYVCSDESIDCTLW
jgi:hypothetical protein